jgi:hypothetical protein
LLVNLADERKVGLGGGPDFGQGHGARLETSRRGRKGKNLPVVIARSAADEAIQTFSAEPVWIASLRSQ